MVRSQRDISSPSNLHLVPDLHAANQKPCQNFISLGSDKNEWGQSKTSHISCKAIHFPRATEPLVVFFKMSFVAEICLYLPPLAPSNPGSIAFPLIPFQ